jgi:hypothetical protein
MESEISMPVTLILDFVSQKLFLNPKTGSRKVGFQVAGNARILSPLRSHSDGRGEGKGEVRVSMKLL